ncbi:MAG: iodotyrosine deiodinase [Bradymonadia bacterium]|jgi:iodotyrosine deiodinase
MKTDAPMIPLVYVPLGALQMRARAKMLLHEARARRTVRDFSDRPIPLDVVRRCIHVAAQAPSGANKQPWTFVLVTDPAIKDAIRTAAEDEERAFYGGRATKDWLEDLEPFATDADKPFLARAPALVVVFAQTKGADGSKHYYVKESVGIATGMLLAALHQCGLATLTHTPSPMGFLAKILGRPANEKAYLLIPVGFPEDDCVVPDITRKSLDEVLVEV